MLHFTCYMLIFMKDHIPERLDKSLSSLSSDVVFNEKAANGSHKKTHKISDIGQISSTLSPLMEIVT